jgi:thiol-disulfide isomerase/thioredoxin
VRNVSFLVLALAVGAPGCADPALVGKLEALEARVQTLEAAKGAAPAARAPASAPANTEDEKAAADLLRQASQAAEAMRYDEAKAKLAELHQKYPDSRPAKAAARLDEELAIVGKPAKPLMVEKVLQGTLPDFASSKPTLVVFWEVWCPHCKEEVPKLQQTYAEYAPKGLQMVGVTKMTKGVTEDQVTAFVHDQHLTYAIAKEGGAGTSEYYGVKGIPAAVVIKDGTVVWRGHPARITPAMLDQFLGS